MESRQLGERGSALAWVVHALTASGVVLALLAIDAVEQGDWRIALLWLLTALVVDGIDGTLARAVRVNEKLPRIDGAALDLVIDYLTYVFIPAVLIWRAGMLPNGVALPLIASILVSSLYVFARRDMKTEDGYFRGFPALWNVVAVYFVLTPPLPWIAAAIVLGFVLLTFAPVHVVHPFRIDRGRSLATGAAGVWAISTVALLVKISAPLWSATLLAVSFGSLTVLVALGLMRTVQGLGVAAHR